MIFSFLWFVVGVAIGVNCTLAYAWLSLRHANRKAAEDALVARRLRIADELRQEVSRDFAERRDVMFDTETGYEIMSGILFKGRSE